jgi:PleD family two-component response regulator
MPGMDGIKVCQNLRREGNGNYVYMLILTGRSHRKDLLQAFAAGADDFVSKPFEPEELEARLKVGARILDLEAELIASREALKAEATHDSLTGAWNRGAFSASSIRSSPAPGASKRRSPRFSSIWTTSN